MSPDETTPQLLRIDVAAQIRKLAGAQLQGDWQLMSECLRFALSQGATRVELKLHAKRAEFVIEGWHIDASLLEAAVALRRGVQDASAAQAALSHLEGHAAVALIVIAGSPRLHTGLVTPRPQGALRFALEAEVAELRPQVDPVPQHATWTLAGLDYDPKRARAHCLEALRFCDIPVLIDGKAPPHPFRGAIDAMRYRQAAALPTDASQDPDVIAAADAHSREVQLAGKLGIPAQGERPRVWVTRFGVLAAHFTAAAGPAFSASIEAGGLLDPRASGEDLRSFGEACLPTLMQVFVKRISKLASDKRPPHERRRLAMLALQGMDQPAHTRALAALPLFDRVLADGLAQPGSLVDLRASVHSSGGRRRLVALRPEDPVEIYELAHGAWRLDDGLRARLSRRLELDIQTPSLRPHAGGLTARLRRRARVWAGRVRSVWRRRPPALDPQDLAPHERALLSAMNQALGPDRSAQLCEGEFAPMWSTHDLFLGRAHPLVRAALRRSQKDPAWAYPAALALSDGAPGSFRLRKRWRPSNWMRLG